jgi:hypothetical protein
MKIPAGTKMLIGPPAKPMPSERREGIRRAVTGIPGIAEAHLPHCYAKGFVDPPAQILVLVLATEAEDSIVVSEVERRLATFLAAGISLDIFPLHDNASVLPSIRSAGCMLNLSED